MKLHVEDITHAEEGMYKVFISFPSGAEFITVIGRNLTECIERTALVLKAFENGL